MSVLTLKLQLTINLMMLKFEFLVKGNLRLLAHYSLSVLRCFQDYNLAHAKSFHSNFLRLWMIKIVRWPLTKSLCVQQKFLMNLTIPLFITGGSFRNNFLTHQNGIFEGTLWTYSAAQEVTN